MVITTMLFVVVTGIIRYLGSNLPAIEGAFIRYALGLLLLSPIIFKLFKQKIPADLWRTFAIRGFIHGIGVSLWFYAMARITIAEVTAIGYLTPIFVTIGAAYFLGETLKLRRIAGVIVGLVGALIILRPGFQEVSIGQLAQLIAAPIFAISYLYTKQLTGRASPEVIIAMLTLFCTLALMPGALMQWQTPSMHEFLLLGCTAVVATAGHYSMTRALKAAPISVTQPVLFLQLVWAAALGVVMFGEPLDSYVLAGGGIIVAAATYISYREAKAAR
ncbi:MAG: EamA family transporter [Hyphomicrobiales bacterium]|nr:MAG: EamA family transporter [Hyphomicrobiales bacterium]